MASSDVAAVPRAPARSRLLDLLGTDGLLVAAVAVYVAALSVRLAAFVNQDTWYTLVGGREVVHHGIPGTDALTYWTLGRQWIDQQWLGQAVSYAVYSAGGIRLLALGHAAVVTSALALAVWGARRRGAGPRGTAVVVVGIATLLLLISSQIRAQTLAYPLFVGVLLLLLEDVRQPGRRVFWTLPLLALWANIHGSVVLGAGLVALRGAMIVLGRRSDREERLKGALLAAGAGASLFLTPYGFRIVDYYHATLLNSSFSHIVEWRAPSLSAATAPLYLLGAGAIWLLGRYGKSFRAYDRLVLLLLLGGAFWSLRNVAWLAFAAAPLLAPAAENLFGRMRPAPARTNVLVGSVAGAIGLIAVIAAATHSQSWFTTAFPARAEAVVARVAAQNPNIRIYANERYGDWLLMTHPELRGRIAYDIRFELLKKAEVDSIVHWRGETTDGWRNAANGARLLLLDPRTESRNERDLLAGGGFRRLYRDAKISVLLRSAMAG